MIGRKKLSKPEADKLYEDARNMLDRYESSVSLDRSSTANYEIDDITFGIRDKTGKYISVLRGNVFDRDDVLGDMVRISALSGRLAELESDLKTTLGNTKKQIKRVKAKLYNEYVNKTHSKTAQAPTSIEADVPRTKVVKEIIENMVQMDTEYQTLEDVEGEQEAVLSRVSNLLKSLNNLENALKYALNYGDRAQ
jgi:hypothetical protein